MANNGRHDFRRRGYYRNPRPQHRTRGLGVAQNRTGRLDVDGKTIPGHASWNDGGHNFTWTQTEQREAEKLFVVKFYMPDKQNHAVEIIAASTNEAKEEVRRNHLHASFRRVEEK